MITVHEDQLRGRQCGNDCNLQEGPDHEILLSPTERDSEQFVACHAGKSLLIIIY